ncbi:bifunctional 4-hydroxy-2-oxoglutarate aldolase/2-dehydro-3-deoxy-phosphogluconate aldolase [Segetibacter sp. 3557_3]|uniref:bifunctional 4-hydroxy-2-oxoglutarate aldolase/2-dehydro-3-deoxy-phosphogluconate aldolase n=1 Tax=Segetibacter sp. 3557_3 TaxID=2547429 RepID=UPI001058AEC5|nr:bifunctional 4-hydroxy-2-oxoglutarate aldolase/2-dehydro-3-deoxy-phosphogluconate aldolase [Segetibacter sp. 3557_3]TDH24544.1 bifunctional 4-hydroxy-2-oxoglutarate aldolase/2-dehydro-3-deoxy-phosphogluconate aldolase [Segetibacter sp. 3557_3]
MDALSHIRHYKIVAIMRGLEPNVVPAVVHALYEGGVRTLEITLNSRDALQVIADVASQSAGRMLIGAGTVLDADGAKLAISAGAGFIISPIVDVDTIAVTKGLGVVSIPGAYTATEIVHAYKNGADIVKVFPASTGPDYIKDLRGPLPHIPLMPTGGVTLQTIKAFHDAGAIAFGIGSALVNAKGKVDDQYLAALTVKARQFVDALA